MKRVGSRHRNAITSRVLSIDACYMILGYSNLAVNLFIAGISLGPEKALMPEVVPMDIATAKSFLAQHHYGVLATRRQDGSPQLSPIPPRGARTAARESTESPSRELPVASAETRAPRFAATVIYVGKHNSEGAFCLVTNRPSPKGPMQDLLKCFGTNSKGAKGEI